MLLFGHTGITLGVAVLLAGLTTRSGFARNREDRVIARHTQLSPATAESNYSEAHKASWFKSLADYVDIRLVLHTGELYNY